MKTTTSMQLVGSASSLSSTSPTVIQSSAVDPSDTGQLTIVAADHPSLDRDVENFLVRLARDGVFIESLHRALQQRGGFRLAAVDGNQIVGLVRVDRHGEMHIAVDSEHRALGIGTRLGKAALERAIDLEYSRVVMRTNRRSRAARRTGEAAGCIVVENARGRTDVIAHLPTGLRSA